MIYPRHISVKSRRTETVTTQILPSDQAVREGASRKSGTLSINGWSTPDAAFCYACQHFGLPFARDSAFTAEGFKHWKKATYKDGGPHTHIQNPIEMQCLPGKTMIKCQKASLLL